MSSNENVNMGSGDEAESNADSGEWLVREFTAHQEEDVRPTFPESRPEPTIAVGVVRSPSGKQIDGGEHDVNIQSVLPAVRWSPSVIVPTESSSSDSQYPIQAQTPTNDYTVTAVPALYPVSLGNETPYKKNDSGVTIACTFCSFKGEGKLQRYKIGLALVTILLITSVALIVYEGPFNLFGEKKEGDFPLQCRDECYDDSDYRCGCLCYEMDDDTPCIYQNPYDFDEFVCKPHCYDGTQDKLCDCTCYQGAETEDYECLNDDDEVRDDDPDLDPLSCPSLCYGDSNEKLCDCACYSEIELTKRNCINTGGDDDDEDDDADDDEDDDEDSNDTPPIRCQSECYDDSGTSCACTCYPDTYEGECDRFSGILDDDLSNNEDDKYHDDDYYYNNHSLDDDDGEVDDNFDDDDDDNEIQACQDACYDESGTICDCTCYVYSSYDGRACNDDDSADYYLGNMEDTPCMNFCYRLPGGDLPERWSPGRCPERCYRHQKQFVKRYNKWAEDIMPEFRNSPLPTLSPTSKPNPRPTPRPTPGPTRKKSKKGGSTNVFQGN